MEANGGPVVTSANYLAVDSTGNLFVLDSRAGHVHKYDASGRYISSLSDADGRPIFLRQPGGPPPAGLAIGRDGNVYVAGAPRDMFPNQLPDTAVISRLSPDLTVDAVYRFGRTMRFRGPEVWRDKLVVVLYRPRDIMERFLGYSKEHVEADEELLAVTYDGTPTMYFHPADERKHDVPYWGGDGSRPSSWQEATSSWRRIRYTPYIDTVQGGEEIGTFGDASPSFRHRSRPAPRSFPTADAAYFDWWTSFTTIGGIEVLADSLVVVSLIDRSGDTDGAIERRYRADVFNLHSGEAVAPDVALEGQVLHADILLYVAWRPTAEGWHIGLFDLMDNRSR